MRNTVSVYRPPVIVEAAESNLKGPIIRINPFEIHIIDPEYIDQIYAVSSKSRDKYKWAHRFTGECARFCAAGTFVNSVVSYYFVK